MSEPDLHMLLASTKDTRQLRLFAVACCRNIWHLLIDQISRNAVEIAESFADGLASEEDLNSAWTAAWTAEVSAAAWVTEKDAARRAVSASAWASAWGSAWNAAWTAVNAATRHAEMEQQLVFLQDITNQPFVELNPTFLLWSNSLLPKFATNIYTNKDFGLMPILADALEEANAPPVFIEHCREKIHIKGCWLLDVLMGKR